MAIFFDTHFFAVVKHKELKVLVSNSDGLKGLL